MIINYVLIFLGLIIGSIADFKDREIPDTLNFSLIALGLAIGVTSSIIYGNIFFLLNSIAGYAAGFLLGNLFYYTGQWGGGDAKMIMGIGALMGISVTAIFSEFHLFLIFIVNSIFVGAVYGIFWMIFLMFKHWASFKKEFSKNRYNKVNMTIRKIFLVISVLIIAAVFIINPDFLIKSIIFFILLVIIVSFYISLIIKSVEKVCMIKKIPVSKLTEGDWIAEKVTLKNNNVYKGSKTGITMEDIKMLKANKIRTVIIKEGIPFIPSFLITFIVTLLLGNWFLFFI